MKKAAIYVRVSSEQQKKEETIESQKNVLLKFAKDQGFEIPDVWIFEDNGISGATLARPGLDKLRDYACEGLFDHLFVLSPDRLSRKYVYQVILVEELSKCNVKVVFHSSPNQNTPEEVLLVQMQGTFAEYERAQITERTRRGKIHKAKNGSVSTLSNASYGYRYINDLSSLKAHFEICDKEANVIKYIFDLYTKNRSSISEIKKCLEQKSIPAPKGGKTWFNSTISTILQNTAYKGVAYYGKTERCEPNPSRLLSRSLRIQGRQSHRKADRKKNKDLWIAIPVPRIIDDSSFEIAQELILKNIMLSKRCTKNGSLLQGLISCKECGYSFNNCTSGGKIIRYRYYRCSSPKSTCSNRGINMNNLDEAVWKSIISILECPELIENEILRRMSELENEPKKIKKKQLENKLDKMKIEMDRLLDAYQEGIIAMDQLKIRSLDLKKEMNNTKREMENTSIGLSKEQAFELKSAVEYFRNHLNKENILTFEDKRKILRMLIKEVRVSKDGIEIDHIIPLSYDSLSQNHKIARLCSGRVVTAF